MKKLFSVLIILTIMQSTYAQRVGGFKFQMDLGATLPQGGGIGTLVNLEPQISVSENNTILYPPATFRAPAEK